MPKFMMKFRDNMDNYLILCADRLFTGGAR